MAVSKAERPVFSFNKGINTDAPILTFPRDYSVDELNFELMLDGTRRRRRGLEHEGPDGVLTNDAPEEAVVRTFKWRTVAGNPDLNFHVVQIADTLYFMDDAPEPSASMRNFTISLVNMALEDYQETIGEYPVDMAFGRGQAIIVSKYLVPHYIEYDEDADDLITTPIDIKERDFQGIDDGVANDARVGALTNTHLYNLVNQGWVYQDILDYFTQLGHYPAKNVIPWLGYRRLSQEGYNVDDGVKEFSPDKLISELFQDAPAPRGHFVRDPFNTAASVDLDAETTKNYIGATHRYNDDEFWSPQNPNAMNFPTQENPVATTLLTVRFVEPHQLEVGDTFEIKTATRGKIGSTTGDNDRWWYLEGIRTVENVVDDHTLSFYNTLVWDHAGFRNTYSNAYYPHCYAYTGGTVLEVEGIQTDVRPTVCAFFAGRAVYAGVPHPDLATTIYISQVVEQDAQYGKCYQVADPTSEKISDLIPTDGLVLRIPEAGMVYKLLPYSNSLLIFASNGVWELGPGASGYFTATSYSIRKVSDVKCVNGTSVVEAEGIPMFWASSGVFVIYQDTNTGYLTVRSISQNTVDVYISEIGEVGRRTATADFDQVNKRVIWCYRKDDEHHALLFDMKFQAFTPWRFEAPVRDIFTTTDREAGGSTLRFIVFDEAEGHAVCSTTSSSFEDLGVDTEAYIVTGFDTASNPAKRKQVPEITVFLARTETIVGNPENFFFTE